MDIDAEIRKVVTELFAALSARQLSTELNATQADEEETAANPSGIGRGHVALQRSPWALEDLQTRAGTWLPSQQQHESLSTELRDMHQHLSELQDDLRATRRGNLELVTESPQYTLTSTQRRLALALPILLLGVFYLVQLLAPPQLAHTIRQFVTFGQ